MSSSAPVLGFKPSELTSLVRRRVLEEHASEAAFLWLQREAAVRAPHFRLSHLERLDARLQAHLAGLRTAGEEGLRAAQRVADPEDMGSMFVLTRSALDGQEPRAMRDAVSVALTARGGHEAVAAALGWGMPARMQPLSDRLAGSMVADYRAIASRAWELMGLAGRPDPGMIRQWASDADAVVRVHGLRAIGVCGEPALLPLAEQALNDPIPACGFAATWSLALRGDEGAARHLMAMGPDLPPARAREAVELAVRRASPEDARSAIRQWAASAETRRLAILAVGAFGEAVSVPWLLDCCDDENLAPLAGEAFSTITGADLRFLDLDRDPPEHLDPDALPMEDRELPWPDRSRLASWWHAHHTAFFPGQRYLAGQTTTPPHLWAVLRTGYQRQRAAAAIELAALLPQAPLFPVHMRGDRQRRALAA